MIAGSYSTNGRRCSHDVARSGHLRTATSDAPAAPAAPAAGPPAPKQKPLSHRHRAVPAARVAAPVVAPPAVPAAAPVVAPPPAATPPVAKRPAPAPSRPATPPRKAGRQAARADEHRRNPVRGRRNDGRTTRAVEPQPQPPQVSDASGQRTSGQRAPTAPPTHASTPDPNARGDRAGGRSSRGGG